MPDSSRPAACEAVSAELRDLYAGALDYPVEEVTVDADLEADLGVDSLRQVELMDRVLSHYGLGKHAERIHASRYPRLKDIAGLVVRLQEEPDPAVG